MIKNFHKLRYNLLMHVSYAWTTFNVFHQIMKNVFFINIYAVIYAFKDLILSNQSKEP